MRARPLVIAIRRGFCAGLIAERKAADAAPFFSPFKRSLSISR
jgi:hypothetical protein